MRAGRLISGMIAVVLASVATVGAAAQDYPSKTIRLIVPFSAGGGTDLIARTIFTALGEQLGWTIAIENHGGAAGSLGTDIVAKAPADGYTIGLVSSAFAINPSLRKDLPFDTVNDFAPISLLVTAPGVLVVSPTVPAKTVQELIALAKATPGAFSYASAGSGTPPHLAAELFKSITGVDMVHVPYKGIGEAYPDIITGRVTMAFPTIPSAMPLIQSGELNGLAVTSSTRATAALDLPTLSEAGVPNYDATSWYGLIAPAGTPPEILEKLQQETAKVLKLPNVQKLLVDQGLDVIGGTPEEFQATIKSEMTKWAEVVKSSGATVD